MEAQVWTLIGLLGATVLGSFVYLGQKIGALGGRLDARIDRLASRTDSLDDRLTGRIDALSAKLDEHLRHHAG